MLRRLGLIASVLAWSVAAPCGAWADEAEDQYAVAAGHYSRQNWKLAVEEFAAFLKVHPDHERAITASFYLGESQVQLGQYDEARVQFQAVVEREPEGRHAKQALFRAGECCYLAGQNDAAATALTAFCEKYPDDALLAHALPYRAELALAGGERDAAHKLFDEALRRFPDGPMRDDCRFGLARVAEAQGDAAAAANLYEQVAASESNPLANDALFQAGVNRYGAADYTGAIAAFERFLARAADHPSADRARMALGWSLHHEQKHAEAQALFVLLVDHEELGTQARMWLGLSQYARSEWPAAAATFLAAAEREPQSQFVPMLLVHAGDSQLRSGRADEAAATFERARVAAPEGVWAERALGGLVRAAAASGHTEAVDKHAAKFAEEFPESKLAGEVRRTWARSQLERGQFADATATLEAHLATIEASEANADSGPDARQALLEDRYQLALAYQGLERREEALAALTPVLATADAELLGHARFLQASLLVNGGQFADAVAPLEQLVESDLAPERKASCLAQLAVCQARTGQTPAAKKSFARLQGEKPAAELLLPAARQLAEAIEATDPAWAGELYQLLSGDQAPVEFVAVGLSGLAWIEFRAGQLNEAEQAFATLLERAPDHPLAASGALARGQVLETLDRPDAALAMYKRVIERHGGASELPEAMLRAARLHDRLKQHGDARTLYERLATECPDHEQADAVLYELAWVLRTLGHDDESDARLTRLRAQHPESRLWGDATFRLAERAQAKQDLAEARRLIDELLARDPQRPVLEHALYLQGQLAAVEQRWDDVEQAMTRLGTEAGDSSLARMAEFWVAESAYRRNEFETAGERFTKLADKIGGRREPWVAMVALRQGQVLGQQNRWADAQVVAEAVLRDWPDLAERYEAEYLLGRALASQAEFEPAREAYRRVIRSATGGKTETAAMAQWMIGESYFHQQNYDAALREYLRLEILYAYPIWQAGALLQAGKCHEQLGEWKEACELYARLLRDYGQTRFAEEAASRLRTAQGQTGTKS